MCTDNALIILGYILKIISSYCSKPLYEDKLGIFHACIVEADVQGVHRRLAEHR